MRPFSDKLKFTINDSAQVPTQSYALLISLENIFSIAQQNCTIRNNSLLGHCECDLYF